MTSFYESIGHVLQEAQMLGVVPVATRLEKSTAFVVTDGQTGRLCRSDDASDFADAIETLHSNRDELARLSHNARKEVRERFAISRLVQQWHDLFGQIDCYKSRDRRPRTRILGTYAVAPELLPSWLTTGARLLRRHLGREQG